MTPRRRAVARLILGGWVLAFAWAAPASAATTYHVAKGHPACSNSGPGTAEKPFCSIGPAAKRAVAGDTVVVAAGTYPESLRPASSGTAGAPIVFSASGAVLTGVKRGVSISSRSWIVVRGFEVTGTTGHGIYVTSSSNISIEGNHVHHVGKPIDGQTASGIYLKTVTDSTVEDNEVHDTTNSGIAVYGSSARVKVSGNSSSANARGYTRAAAGIDVRNSAGVVVEANRTWNNEDTGIQMWTSSGGTIRNNRVWLNGDHGIDNKGSPGTAIVANTVYDSVDSGIEVVGNATGVTVANNISVDNGIASPRTSGNLRIDSTASSGVTLDYDLLWLSTPGVMVDWRGTAYPTLAAFVAATGREPRGIEADPLLDNPGAGNLRLRAGSPAIDSADSGAPGHPSADAVDAARVDDPATPDAGTGPRTYDDRGALEYQP